MYKIEPLFLRRLKIIKLTSGIKYRKRRLGISRGRDLVPMARTNARAMLDELGMLVYLPSCEHINPLYPLLLLAGVLSSFSLHIQQYTEPCHTYVRKRSRKVPTRYLPLRKAKSSYACVLRWLSNCFLATRSPHVRTLLRY